jgi:uncharacterized RDD family membrane protein YckC
LIVLTVVFLGTSVLLAFTHALDAGTRRPLIQFGLLALLGAYFIYCWVRGGQTLPMRAWRLRLATADGGPVPPQRAMVRYLVAVIGASCAGLGFAWALWDRERQFLHDRIAGTRIVTVEDRGSRTED